MCEIPADAAVYVFIGAVDEVISAYMKLLGEAKLPPKYAFGVWISANHWNSQQDVENVYVFIGAVDEVISAYMKLLGEAKLPPKYAFGVWISANHWNSQQDVENQMKYLEKYQFPASVMVLEAWSDEATFYIWNGASYEPKPDGGILAEDDFDYSKSSYWSDPAGMIRRLHDDEATFYIWNGASYEPKPDGGILAEDDFDYSKSSYWSDPAGMIRRLHDRDIHLVLWQIPVYKGQSEDEEKNRQLIFDKEDAIRRGFCVKNEDGTPYQIPVGNWFETSLIPDFSNQSACESWFAKRQYLLDMGVDGFKTDGGEFIYRPDVMLKNGMDGTEAKNAYSRLYTEAYTQFLGNDHVLFSRAGSRGAHRMPIHWGGDQQSENSELRAVFGAGLSAAMTGIPFWSFDIAGFAGPLPTADLYRRATQLACFVPALQWHSEPDGGQFKEIMPGADGNNERSPWNIAQAWGDSELLDEIRFWHNLHMNLVPYIYSSAVDCCEEYRPMMRPLVYTWSKHRQAVEWEDEYMFGESLLVAPLFEENQTSCCEEYRPMMRPLVYTWSKHRQAVEWEDEYMFGESLLVAPLFEENQTSRKLWLPPGKWYGFFSKKQYSGDVLITSEERFPVYIRDGHAVAMKEYAQEDIGKAGTLATEDTDKLHFVLAGACGKYRFRDEKSEIVLSWEQGKVESDIKGAKRTFTWEIIK